METGTNECDERVRLAEEYTAAVSKFGRRLEELRRRPVERTEAAWEAAELARVEAENAWKDLETHIREHACLPLFFAPETGKPAEMVLVADDERRFVEASESVTEVLGLRREDLLARRIDDVIVEARGESVPKAWESFVAEGMQSGICQTIPELGGRRFEYKAKANVAPGLHVAVLRELEPAGRLG